ncbi:MAG TPA: DUF4190 domain-containing protein [Mycobacteriales bacterium]|nr:DUF4190 domain-containing protein [Mycobacteriales bacterium]
MTDDNGVADKSATKDNGMADEKDVTGEPENAPAWPEEEPGDLPVRNGLATAALVLGIISIPGIYLLGVLDVAFIVLGIVFGILALRQVKRGTCTKKGFAIAGIVTGGVGAILLVVAIIVSQRAISDCKDKIGPHATDKQIQTCLDNKRHKK